MPEKWGVMGYHYHYETEEVGTYTFSKVIHLFAISSREEAVVVYDDGSGAS